MFVKIKFESTDQLRAPLIFNVDEASTIFELKRCMEKHINIPVDKQEILTLSKTLSNHDSLANVMEEHKDLGKINRAAISLYSMNKFVCFLQFYTKNGGDEQCKFPNQPLDAIRLPIDNMPRYSEVSSNRKRKQIIGCDASENGTCLKSESVESNAQMNAQTEPTLESFAECVAEVHPTVRKQTINAHLGWDSVSSSNQSFTIEPIETGAAQVPVNNQLSESISSSSPYVSESAPYDTVRPEQRRYAVIINNDIDNIRPSDYTRIMSHYFDLFQTSQCCEDLNFNDQSSVSLFEGKLWVVCEDSDTCEWIAKGVRSLSPYKCFSFISFYGLIKCRIVLPRFVDTTDLTGVFKLLEVQNQGITTGKWCVMDRKLLEEENGANVSKICENEILTLYVDQATRHYIQERDLKIKYCFWRLTFEFSDP